MFDLEKKLENYLRGLEHKLIYATSREEAYNLIKNYDKDSLDAIQKFLNAHTRTKNRHGVLQAILQCTYDVYNSRQITTNKE